MAKEVNRKRLCQIGMKGACMDPIDSGFSALWARRTHESTAPHHTFPETLELFLHAGLAYPISLTCSVRIPRVAERQLEHWSFSALLQPQARLS